MASARDPANRERQSDWRGQREPSVGVISSVDDPLSIEVTFAYVIPGKSVVQTSSCSTKRISLSPRRSQA